MSPFEHAWTCLKADDFNLWPPEENDTTPIKATGGPTGHNVIDMDDMGSATSHVNLPNISQYGNEEDIARRVIGQDIHEDSHKALAQIGEFYDNPRLDEWFPHIAEAEYQTRDTQFPADLGMLARLMMRHHPQVKRGTYEHESL